MSWQAWQWTFELESSLHAGYHKIMHLYRTRPYLPAKNLWAAITERLTQWTGSQDFMLVGEQVKKCMRFGYLYPHEDGLVLRPELTSGGWKYGGGAREDFDRRYLNVFASTAVEASSLAAEDESLHEVEVLHHWRLDGSLRKTALIGVFWVNHEAEVQDVRVQQEGGELGIVFSSFTLSLAHLANRLQVGGERRYGLGRLRMVGKPEILSDGFRCFPGTSRQGTDDGPLVSLAKGESIWAHAQVDEGFSCNGDVEALVGRDWDAARGAGRHLSKGMPYWAPGAVVGQPEAVLEVDGLGFWRLHKKTGV